MTNRNLIFPQLFVKSSHSIFESTISIDQIIEFSLKNKHKHSFFTESQVIKHFPTFHLQASNKGLIPLLSLQYTWKNLSEWLLIPKNYEGYFSLSQFIKGKNIKEEEWENILKIFISGDENERAWKSDNFFLANSNCSKGIAIKENLFLKEEDYDLFTLISAIKNKSNFAREKELNSHLQEAYLLSIPSSKNIIWTKNLINLLKECKYYSLRSSQVENSFKTSKEEILEYSTKKLDKYISNLSTKEKKEYKERFEREIKLFDSKNYWEYFSIVWELMKFLSSSDILIGPGRGSSCGSLLLFLMGVNQIDPIKYGLLLDRFLNESSNRLPDLDIDIEGSRRLEALNFLKDKFGEENFIIPSIIKRVKNVNLISSTLSKILEEKKDTPTQTLNKLIDIPFLTQPHPSSIIPLFGRSESFLEHTYKDPSCIFPVTPLEYSTTSYLSLQKIDLLSSQYLEFLSEIYKEVGLTKEKLSEIDFSDKNSWALLNKGLTYYLFHLDSSYIRSIIPSFNLSSISDLAQLLAIIRPGINRHIPKFVNQKIANNMKCPQLIKELLLESRGIILFQEQIMTIVSKVTGMPLSYSDKYRIALQKEKTKELISLKKEFFELSLKNGREMREIQEIWNFINTFGKYSFNKSHAIAYAALSFKAAYLKANYTSNFFISAIKREGLFSEVLKEINSLGYQIKVSNYFDKLTYTGFFNEKNKEFYIGINGLKYGGLALFQLLEKCEKELINNSSNLEALISFLLSKGISKEDIQKLNYLNWFDPIFKERENSLFLKYRWETLYKKIVFGSAPNIEEIIYTQEEIENFEKERIENLNFEWNKYFHSRERKS